MTTPDNYPMFVSSDGLYGSAEELRQFSYGDLTEDQWHVAASLDGFDRFCYINAIIDGDEEEILRILGEGE